MGDITNDVLFDFLEEIGREVKQIFLSSPFIQRLPDGIIKSRILDYSLRGGKNLRPALLCAASCAVGGSIEQSIMVGAAIEMFHTWTLVHDDIIDQDLTRRGGPTIHKRIFDDFKNWTDSAVTRAHLAHSLALLTGDAQHGFVLELMTRAATTKKLSSDLVLHLISDLEGVVLPELLCGEVSDVLQTAVSLETITQEEIERMSERKTGALLEFSVVAGGMIGINTTDRSHPRLTALSLYGKNLGIAFQLRDDILGILGNEKTLGKPIGSDFREGKRTLPVKFAYSLLNAESKNELSHLIGKADLSDNEVDYLKSLIVKSGAIELVEEKAEKLINDSCEALGLLPQSRYRDILEAIATYTVSRNK